MINISNERKFHDDQPARISSYAEMYNKRYGQLSSSGSTVIWLKPEYLASCSTEAIQHMGLKIITSYYHPNRYLYTMFCENLKWSSFFCVDLAWNYPLISAW